MPPGSPRFWRQAFRLQARQGAPGAAAAAPRLLAGLAPELLAAGRAALLLRASRGLGAPAGTVLGLEFRVSRGPGAPAGLLPADGVQPCASMEWALARLERNAAEQGVPALDGPAHARLQRTKDAPAGDLYERCLGAAAALSEARSAMCCGRTSKA